MKKPPYTGIKVPGNADAPLPKYRIVDSFDDLCLARSHALSCANFIVKQLNRLKHKAAK